MSKFKHSFKLSKNAESFLEYSCEGNTARIDFITESCIRVAIYKSEQDILPTFSVNPNNVFSEKGRNRLSTEDFDLYSPKVNLSGNAHTFVLPDGIKIELKTDNFLLSYYKNGSLLFSDRAPLAYNFENEFGKDTYHYITRTENERIFGLGDKGGELNKAGRAFRIETTDCMGYDAK